MVKNRDDEFIRAVTLICRNSVTSPERNGLIKQIAKSHVYREFENLHMNSTNTILRANKLKELLHQLTTRGFI